MNKKDLIDKPSAKATKYIAQAAKSTAGATQPSAKATHPLAEAAKLTARAAQPLAKAENPSVGAAKCLSEVAQLEIKVFQRVSESTQRLAKATRLVA